jgi:ATP-dependent DNA helicase DinG
VVAVLDSRLATARYGSFLRASLPPFWPTADKAKVLAALQRLDESAGELRVVHDPTSRTQALRDNPSAPTVVAPNEPAPVPDATRTAVVLGRAWTAEDDALLREGVELGCTLDDLADQFDCEPDVVQGRLDDLGLTAASDELF